MYANNIIYILFILQMGEKTFKYVGSVQQHEGWRHCMMGSLRGQSHCWIFCKALQVFPPSMWSVKIIKIATENILVVEDQQIRKENAIYPGGFNLQYNVGERGNLYKLVKYMRDFNSKKKLGIAEKNGKFQLTFYPVSGKIKYKTKKKKRRPSSIEKKLAQESKLKNAKTFLWSKTIISERKTPYILLGST